MPLDPHHFKREKNGSVRLRIRLTLDEASTIEEGAGTTPLMEYMRASLLDAATRHAAKRRTAGKDATS